MSTLDALSTAFQFAPDEPPENVMHGLELLYDLMESVDQAIEKISSPGKRARYKEKLTIIRSVVHPKFLGVPWNDRKGALTPDVMTVLELCAHDLAELPQGQVVDDKALAELQGAVAELADKILEQVDLDERLREFLIRHLEQVRRAIVDYRLRGGQSLDDALDAVVGSIVRNRGVARQAVSTPEGRKFWDIVRKLSEIVTLARGVRELAPSLSELVGGLLTSSTT